MLLVAFLVILSMIGIAQNDIPRMERNYTPAYKVDVMAIATWNHYTSKFDWELDIPVQMIFKNEGSTIWFNDTARSVYTLGDKYDSSFTHDGYLVSYFATDKLKTRCHVNLFFPRTNDGNMRGDEYIYVYYNDKAYKYHITGGQIN